MSSQSPGRAIDWKRCAVVAAAALGVVLAEAAGRAVNAPADARTPAPTRASQEQARRWMTFGTHRFAVSLEDSPTARAFVDLLPATVEMPDLNNNEKHVTLPRSLPTAAVRPGTIGAAMSWPGQGAGPGQSANLVHGAVNRPIGTCRAVIGPASRLPAA